MVSPEGEIVELSNKLCFYEKGRNLKVLEKWLNEVEVEMRNTLKSVSNEAL